MMGVDRESRAQRSQLREEFEIPQFMFIGLAGTMGVWIAVEFFGAAFNLVWTSSSVLFMVVGALITGFAVLTVYLSYEKVWSKNNGFGVLAYLWSALFLLKTVAAIGSPIFLEQYPFSVFMAVSLICMAGFCRQQNSDDRSEHVIV
jgi:hypothetical protein